MASVRGSAANTSVAVNASLVEISLRSLTILPEPPVGTYLMPFLFAFMTVSLVVYVIALQYRAPAMVVLTWLRSKPASTPLKRRTSTVDINLDELEGLFEHPDIAHNRLKAPSKLLSRKSVDHLVAYLPGRFAKCGWHLMYSSAQDGSSLNTLYRKGGTHPGSPVILVIKDTLGSIFGVFSTEPWAMSSAHFSNGETFVFRLYPHFSVHLWTRANAFFATGKHDFIAVGGGSNFALWLDKDLSRGSSQWSDTFDNPVLSSDVQFVCHSVEMWSIR